MFCDLIRTQADQRFAIEHDMPFLRSVNAGHRIEESGLAGSVRPNDADDLALFQLEIHFVYGYESPEALYHVVCINK
jgi:hypothetical protein